MAHERQETTIYSMDDWRSDGDFRAETGQEISEEVYNSMLNTTHPESLPKARAEYALQVLGIPVHSGFITGEPHSSDKDGQPLYMAFGMNDFGRGVNHKEPHYYYLGLCHKPEPLNGSYYLFDCLNAFLSDRLFKVSEFADDSEAIATAANYEAVLLLYEFRDNEKISMKTLYDPWNE